MEGRASALRASDTTHRLIQVTELDSDNPFAGSEVPRAVNCWRLQDVPNRFQHQQGSSRRFHGAVVGCPFSVWSVSDMVLAHFQTAQALNARIEKADVGDQALGM